MIQFCSLIIWQNKELLVAQNKAKIYISSETAGVTELKNLTGKSFWISYSFGTLFTLPWGRVPSSVSVSVMMCPLLHGVR
jgi:hypothetical protein